MKAYPHNSKSIEKNVKKQNNDLSSMQHLNGS